jgi:hypothetical protein
VGEPIPGAESAAMENPFKRSLQTGNAGRISLDTVPFL